MLKKVILVSALTIILYGSAFPQMVGSFPTKSDNSATSGFSLLDPGKFHMTQSYSLMYSSSSAGSQSLGLYLNSIEYQVSDPLKIRLDIGYLHNTGALFGNNNGTLSNNGEILPGLAISWKPTENLHFQFNYRQVPGYYYNPYDRYDSNYWFPETGRGY